MKNTIKYPYYLIALTMCIGLAANAQKLPNVQAAAVYAPDNVKVDGKSSEWNNQFQAYNKSTVLFYTLANNNDNLYLAVQVADNTIVNKILSGGLTLTITSKDKNIPPVTITSPLLSAANKGAVTQKTGRREPILDTELPEINKALSNGLKEMTVKGIPSITEPSISVYNEYGIKAAGQLDINKAYTFEMAIPLKYISQQAGTSGAFNYNIKLNGAGSTMQDILSQLPAGAVTSIRVRVNGGTAVNGSSIEELSSPTDFSGNYTLIKK